jgi:hypothetical protein
MPASAESLHRKTYISADPESAREAGTDPGLRAAALAVVIRSGVGGMIQTVSNDPISAFDVVRVDTASWLDIGQPGTRPVRQTWRARY